MLSAFDAYPNDGDPDGSSVVDPLAARADDPEGVGTVADVEAAADGGVAADSAVDIDVGTTATEDTGIMTDSNGTESDSEFSADEILATLNEVTEREIDSDDRQPTPREEVEATLRSDAETVATGGSSGSGGSDATAASVPASGPDDQALLVRELKADIAAMETKTRKMLSFYREFGPGTPLNAHFAAGGDGDRKLAYAHNRTLRLAGLIEHVGRGHYDYRLRDLLGEELSGHVTETQLEAYVAEIESTALDG